MKKSDQFDASSVNVDYVEEVDEKDLYDKKNQSDIIYVESSESKIKSGVLFILAILFVLFSLFSILFGFVYMNKVGAGKEGVTYDLFVVHSNNHYGANNISFANYNSLEKAYNYNLSIKNNNEVSLKYNIEIENPNFGNDGIDQSNIKYSLSNYENVISTGNFKNIKNFELIKMDINANTNQKLNLKVWSNNIAKDLKYSFKINITV